MKLLNKELLERKIDEIAFYDLENHNVFGSSYLVCQNGITILKKYYGETGNGGAMNGDALFRLASLTKPITAVAMMILEERGLISISDNVSRYIPEFKYLHIKSYNDGSDMGKPEKEPTVLSLLTHTSGFGISTTAQLTESDRENYLNTVKYFVDKGLKFEPFKCQEYSAYAAFDVLALIAEKVTGEDYGEFLKREIFEPCAMNNTTFIPTDEQRKRIVKMHDRIDGENAVSDMFPGCIFENFPCEHKLAGAGLISSLGDYAQFAKMLLHKGKTDYGRIMSEKTAVKQGIPYVSKEVMPGKESWGLGVRVIVDNLYENLPVGAFGWSGAYGSHFWIDYENDICAVFMKNSRFDGGAGNQSACRFEKAVHDSLG